MSHEKPTHQNLEDTKLTAIEEQKFALIELQAEHAMILEAGGMADRAREVLISSHRHLTERLGASDLEADLPPAPRVGNDGDITRVAIASSARTRNGAKIECPSVAFITTTLDGTKPHQDYKFVPIAEVHKDGILTLDGFTPEDVILAEGLLEELRSAKTRGALPNLDNSMAAIRQSDDSMGVSMSQVRRISP